ncbi:YkvA family protein [Oceanicoccus sp. KOV_DT_Chl]|uniref:YkvA family protein n=1 Tax=Oceanicoccus sp. KOV_DT_Chl TaxID=1904639 RepID=UPI000C7C8FCD|nr:YkvA family protein [Oceanicoccus sp. KOV_DT_Chl]
MDENTPDYPASYSEQGFWKKLANYAKTAGSEVVERALLLYYAAQKPAVPAWARATIIASLGYFISPIDAIPDLTPLLGYSDDLGVLALAIATVAAYIDDEVRQQAKAKMQQWFMGANEE